MLSPGSAVAASAPPALCMTNEEMSQAMKIYVYQFGLTLLHSSPNWMTTCLSVKYIPAAKNAGAKMTTPTISNSFFPSQRS